MTRLLSTACVAALALLAAHTTAATRIHIHALATTPAPTPSASPSTNKSSSSTAQLIGQVVGSSVAISNATLTSCTETRWTFSQPDAPFVSVHFARFHILDGDVVTIATADGTTSKHVTAPSGGAIAFSSPRVPGPTAVVSFTPKGCLAAKPLPSAFKLEVDAFEYLYKKSYSSVGESREICGAANQNKAAVCFKKAANVSSQVYTKARAVARLLKSSSGLQSACTGFLLGSEGHLMTNHHCIKSAAEANATTFEFMVQSPSCSDATCRQIGECADQGKVASTGSDFVFASEKYDYAIVKLRCKPCLVNGKYGYLSLRKKEPKKGEPIYVVQHPNGGGKQITMQQDVDKDGDDDDDEEEAGGTSSSTKKGVEQAVVAKVNDENAYGDFWTSYYADTEGGSSGSPVLSLNDHAVLALHANGACKNSGAPSHLIIADIQKNKVALPDDAFA